MPGSFPGNHFLGTDAKGRVFFLDGEALATYEVSPHGLGEPSPLEALDGMRDRTVRDAAMGESEGDWLLYAGQDRVLRFEAGEEKPIPPIQWFVSTVTYFDGDPAAIVLPASLGHRLDGAPGEHPWLVSFDGSAWDVVATLAMEENVAREIVETSRAGAESPLTIMRGHYATRVAPDGDGGLWVADTYKPRLRGLDRRGAVEDTLTAGGLDIDFVDLSQGDKDALVAAAKAQGMEAPPPQLLQGGRLRKAADDVAVARDGKVYLLVAGDALGQGRTQRESDLALDRYDPTLLTYERVELDLPGDSGGRTRLALGRDGVYVLTYRGGLSFASWDAIERADWKPLHHVERNGRPLVQPLAAPEPTR